MERRPITSLGDEELIRDARQGNREAFDELVRRFRNALVAIARQATGSQELAEDVVQDSLLQAFHALPQLRDPGKFFGWLGVITRSRARRVGARDQRYEPTSSEALEHLLHTARGGEALEVSEALVRASEQGAVRSALAQLPPEHETVLRLYYFEQWSVRQIAAHLSIPTATVKWRLHRGRHLLRERLTQRPASASGLDELIGAPRGRPIQKGSGSLRGRHRALRRNRAFTGRASPLRLVPLRSRREISAWWSGRHA
jgi:RNA polymerase sigma factor (sigma-70 family)